MPAFIADPSAAASDHGPYFQWPVGPLMLQQPAMQPKGCTLRSHTLRFALFKGLTGETEPIAAFAGPGHMQCQHEYLDLHEYNFWDLHSGNPDC